MCAMLLFNKDVTYTKKTTEEVQLTDGSVCYVRKPCDDSSLPDEFLRHWKLYFADDVFFFDLNKRKYWGRFDTVEHLPLTKPDSNLGTGLKNKTWQTQ